MKQRILFITPGLFKGGAETQLIKVARFLRSQQNEVMIISLKPINFFEVDLEKEGIAVVYLNHWLAGFIPNSITLIKTVKTYKADVVIAFMFIAIIFARLLKVWFRFKLISSIRIAVIKKKWYLPFKMTRGLDDLVVYNSHASKANFEQQKLVSKPGIVINNAISLPPIKTSYSQLISAQPFLWVCIAHFKYNKDYPTLFKAVSLLKDKNVQLDIVGNLHDQEWPYEMIEQLKIQDCVHLLGYQHNSTHHLDHADAFVLSSFSEGMPNGVLEAMACSKPVVVTDIDCNKELVNGANCGFLFKQGDAQDLASKMVKLMDSPLREQKIMGVNGRQYIETNFAEEKVMEDWQAAIHLLSEKELVRSAEFSGQ